MTAPSLLPPEFEDLESFVAAWALPTTAQRAAARDASSEADRASFYDAAKDRLAAAIAYLDARPLDGLCEEDERLMNLVLALAHVALAVEVQGPEEASHREPRRKMRVTRASADHRARSPDHELR